MKRAFRTLALAAFTLTVGLNGVAHAGTVAVELLGSPVTIQQGSSSTIQVLFTISGNNNHNADPGVDYCGTVTLTTAGFVCSKDRLSLTAGQNYTVKGIATKITRTITVNVNPDVDCNTSFTFAMPLKTEAGTGLEFAEGTLQIARSITVDVACAAPAGVFGCGHGFWKNHASQWPAGYADRILEELFDFPGDDYAEEADDSLMAALNYPNESGQSKSVVGKGKILLIQAVAAVLNAVHYGPTFPYGSLVTVTTDVNAALMSQNKDTIEALKDQLDIANNTYCSLN